MRKGDCEEIEGKRATGEKILPYKLCNCGNPINEVGPQWTLFHHFVSMNKIEIDFRCKKESKSVKAL